MLLLPFGMTRVFIVSSNPKIDTVYKVYVYRNMWKSMNTSVFSSFF